MKQRYQLTAKIIRTARKKSGKTQMELSRALKYESGQYISNMERGLAAPPKNQLGRISKILNIKPMTLIEAFLKQERQDLIERNINAR